MSQGPPTLSVKRVAFVGKEPVNSSWCKQSPTRVVHSVALHKLEYSMLGYIPADMCTTTTSYSYMPLAVVMFS